MTLKFPKNELLERTDGPAVDMKQALADKATVYKSKRDTKREFKKLFREESAREALAGLYKGVEIFGFTKGQFSLIELLKALLEKTGPAYITLSTWTAANADLHEVLEFLKAGDILGARFLLDASFQRRQPEVAHMIRERFGMQSLRITQNHAKFILLHNKEWRIVVKTSMNLNTNPRLEDFDISQDPDLWRFLNEVVGALFEKLKAKKQAIGTPGEIWKEWADTE